MLHLSTILKHYKRNDIQLAMLTNAQGREVGIKYSNGSFGKRPQVLMYPKDIIAAAQDGVTSFHISEEHWSNPMLLRSGLSAKELDELRTGWDLIIDVDCPAWEISKLITHHIVQALLKHGVKSVSVKFSGNKGFHIGVPFKAFPQSVYDRQTKGEFPEGTKRILTYLGWFVDSEDNNRAFSKELLSRYSLEELGKELDLNKSELVIGEDEDADEQTGKAYYLCESCGFSKSEDSPANESYIPCPRCKSIMRPQRAAPKPKKGKQGSEKRLNIQKILNLDAILISSRHMYRSVYSLHEKSGLCSVPVHPNKVLEFKKEDADPRSVKTQKLIFLDDSKTQHGEASALIREAYDFVPELGDEDHTKPQNREYEEIKEAIPEMFFPPCIQYILKGVKDGRKRGVFVLLNFLRSVGWSYDMINERLEKWNQDNHEPLREGYIGSHVRYHKNNKKQVLPPNCGNDLYYANSQECRNDPFHKYIKNPVQYAKRKAKVHEQNGKKAKAKKKPAGDKKARKKQ